jgi:hypothetical protein
MGWLLCCFWLGFLYGKLMQKAKRMAEPKPLDRVPYELL